MVGQIIKFKKRRRKSKNLGLTQLRKTEKGKEKRGREKKEGRKG